MKRPKLYTLHSSLFAFLLLAAAGCSSYEIKQTSHFANDDGKIVRVDYGRAEKDHVNTFVSPANGKTLEHKTKLVVEVTMPDGEDFTAWQCMNFNSNGTMYRTDDEEWVFLASGFTCRIAQRDTRYRSGYRDVFAGVLCNTPVEMPKKDDRWYKVRTSGTKYKTK